MPAPIDVVAAVIEHDGLFLACRRAAHKAAAGKWEFPGGKVEPGESPAEALEREIREELGIGIHVTGHLTTDMTGPIRLICLIARLDGERPTASTDHDELRWVAREGLAGLDWAEADLPAVRRLSA
ncbi:(deoxy)nucleoside triphosphate pyrophosphohydrolase [Microbacterium sp. 4R-513]|uniref:(deoxy)nucleoside triphosphate pyrophosphohydrolase n=1 Tax=Microbacterium sp. 4R-513 TaxID=2567934 RepID=UPI0013E1A8AA|nr:(deoxy)nucleoside triphosphate pyrophosphohydrolase [Microbacterium sp. 4R-513]QIG39695.1 (deoxy)nucleoside triphosphate pyrophosphohydrolase [Microbacterium sp. 4R-513]